jgi:hypothetical protein
MPTRRAEIVAERCDVEQFSVSPGGRAMDRLTSPDRQPFLAGAVATLSLGARAQGVQALNIAVIGEIDQHIYEEWYAFNPPVMLPLRSR